MYRGYVTQLDSQSTQSQQQVQSSQPSGNNMADDEQQWRKQWVSKKTEELWAALEKGGSKSLLKQHLTKDVYEKLKDKNTDLGGTLAQCMSSGKNITFIYFCK
jgi:two-component SAPR family response regulator